MAGLAEGVGRRVGVGIGELVGVGSGEVLAVGSAVGVASEVAEVVGVRLGPGVANEAAGGVGVGSAVDAGLTATHAATSSAKTAGTIRGMPMRAALSPVAAAIRTLRGVASSLQAERQD